MSYTYFFLNIIYVLCIFASLNLSQIYKYPQSMNKVHMTRLKLQTYDKITIR